MALKMLKHFENNKVTPIVEECASLMRNTWSKIYKHAIDSYYATNHHDLNNPKKEYDPPWWGCVYNLPKFPKKNDRQTTNISNPHRQHNEALKCVNLGRYMDQHIDYLVQANSNI